MANEHHEPHREEGGHKKIHTAPSHASGGHGGGGGAGKWIAGAAVAALLVGGGYYLLNNNTSAPTEQAALSEDFNTSAPEVSVQDPVAETASSDAAPAPRRAASNAPAEEVVGVTPASYTGSGVDDDIVVDAQRRPVWTSRPNARRLSESYPYRALEAGTEGEAQVSCTIGAGGAMNCVKVSETPSNAGFGAAAVHVAQLYRHADTRADGSAAAGTPVNMRVLFRQGE